MTFKLSLEIELDAKDQEQATEQARDIAEDIFNWPAVISVSGDPVKS